MLRDPETGTLVLAEDSCVLLGHMPDLGRIAAKLHLLPDLYVRDSLEDVGLVPNPLVFQSPDILVRTAPGVPAAFGSDRATTLANDPVRPLMPNHVFVRVFNRGGVNAEGVRITVYWSEPATLVDPNRWRRVGVMTATTVPVEPSFAVAELGWLPSPLLPPPGGHACFIAVVDHPQDPAPPLVPGAMSWEEFLHYVGTHNNVAWRNFSFLHPSLLAHLVARAELPGAARLAEEGPAWEFLVRGAPDRSLPFGLDVFLEESPRCPLVAWLGLAPALGEVLVPSLPPELRERIRLAEDYTWLLLPTRRYVSLGTVRMPAGAEYACRLSVSVDPSVGPLLPGAGKVAVRQRIERLEVGRVAWAFPPPPESQ
jgi:hypothetical protein